MVTSLRIDDALKDRVEQLAARRGSSPSGIMLEAIAQYVEREEAREGFRQEALAAWTDYSENGRHLTGQEVRGWLASWGHSDGPAVPECHR